MIDEIKSMKRTTGFVTMGRNSSFLAEKVEFELDFEDSAALLEHVKATSKQKPDVASGLYSQALAWVADRVTEVTQAW